MSIRKIGQRWQVRLHMGGGLDRFEETLPRGATRDDARALEAKVRRTKIDAAVGRQQKYLIDDAIEQWIKTGADKLKSYQRDLRYRLDILLEYAAGRSLDDLPKVSEEFKVRAQQEGLKAASINRYVAVLRRLGNLAERWGWTDLPLGRRISLLPENTDRHVYLTVQELQTLTKKADPVVADMIRFAALTGLRLAEMLALRPEQIRGGLIILDTNTKSGRPRGIPLPSEAATIAAKRLPWAVQRSLLRKRFVAAREAAGLPHVRWHDLRHTYASWLVQAGQPLTAVRDLLGHSSLSVTHRYAHLAPAHLAAAVATLPRLGVRVGKKKKAVLKKKAA